MARAAQLSARRAALLENAGSFSTTSPMRPTCTNTSTSSAPLFAWLYSDREWHRQRMDYHAKLEEEHRLREDRYRKHLKEIESLNDIPIVVNALAWNSGYPLGAASPLSRTLDIPSSPQPGEERG